MRPSPAGFQLLLDHPLGGARWHGASLSPSGGLALSVGLLPAGPRAIASMQLAGVKVATADLALTRRPKLGAVGVGAGVSVAAATEPARPVLAHPAAALLALREQHRAFRQYPPLSGCYSAQSPERLARALSGLDRDLKIAARFSFATSSETFSSTRSRCGGATSLSCASGALAAALAPSEPAV
jgi:hypothetical protein